MRMAIQKKSMKQAGMGSNLGSSNRNPKKPTQQQSESSATDNAGSELRVIKKYPNRRLYDTQTSSYVTLADIKNLVMEQVPFQVLDAKTSEDITRSILMQIILEEESGGMPIFSTQTLSQIIRFYGHSLQGMMSPYLESNLSNFIDMQNKFAAQSQQLGQAMTPDSWFKFMQQNAHLNAQPMSSYMEQGKKFFEEMQNQTSSLFAGFPFGGNSSSGKK